MQLWMNFYESYYDDRIMAQASDKKEDSIQVRQQLLEPTPEVDGNDLHAEVMLPRRNSDA